VNAPLIDSHCHLADEVFAADLDAVIARALEAGLERVLTILAAGDEKEASQAERVAALWPESRFAIGVHPHTANTFAAEPAQAAKRVRQQLATTPAARAVGEIGLDYHYDFAAPSVQKQVFRAQVALARELDLPVVIHTRDADDDTLRILREEGKKAGRGALRGVLHCFTGTPALARAALDLGFYLSFSGVVTFPRAADVRQAAQSVPLDRVLIETDSPFLAPVPHRGTRNEPAHVARVADALAALHGVPADDVCRRTAANFHALFRP
jgi:TatD DNase family protein